MYPDATLNASLPVASNLPVPATITSPDTPKDPVTECAAAGLLPNLAEPLTCTDPVKA